MESSGRESVHVPKIEICDSPSRDMIQEICCFVNSEADWNQTVFDLEVADGTFAVARNTNNEIIGVSSSHALSPRNLWLGNVCVAKTARRSGLASRLVNSLLDVAAEQRIRSHIVLLASKLGEGVYRRLGFRDVRSVAVASYRRTSLPLPNFSTTVAGRPTAQEHDDAIRLEGEIGGSSRKELLRKLFEKDNLCAVAKTDSSVVAAAWGRYKAPTPSTNEITLHVGPVVAKTPDLAMRVVAELLRMARADDACASTSLPRASALVVRIGDNKASEQVFESLGFEKAIDAPYLQKSIHDGADPSPRDVDLACATDQCYATMWWDIA